MQQRYYDPGIGRFLSVDAVTADGNTGENFNRYWYANNNPYKFTDPDGRLTWDEFTTGVKNFIAPTGQQFAQRGEAGTPASNAMGAVKQVANTVINVVGAVIQTPADRLTGGGLPNIPIANNELAGAAAAELGINITAVAAPLARSTGSSPAATSVSIQAGATRSSATQITAGTTASQARSVLSSNGFTWSGSATPGAGSMTNGKAVYNFYPASASNGVPTAKLTVGEFRAAAIRFLPEE